MTDSQVSRPNAGFCPGCGEARDPGKAFCANCGRSFEGAPESDTGQVPRGQGLGAITGADAAILGGAALLIAAPFFPFLSATAALIGSISRSGVEITGGEAIVMSAVGGIAAFLAARSLGRPKGAGPILLGLAGLGLSMYYYLQVDDRVQSIGSDLGFASIGAGIWMALAGSGLLVIATLAANRRP